MSYAFPMIYSAETNNYYNTFNELSSWFSSKHGDNTGELKFLSNFINCLFDGDELLDSCYDIHLIGDDSVKQRIFSMFEQKILPIRDNDSYGQNHVEPDVFSVPFKKYHSFLITMRNRFFHYSHSNKNNISLDDIGNAEFLFSLINKISLQYITTLFHAIVWRKLKSEQNIISNQNV